MILVFGAALLALGEESDYYRVDHLKPPPGCVLEVGGMDFLPGGQLVVSTRRGEVWVVDHALADDPSAAKFTRFADGLWEGLGLAVVGGEIFVLQRGELSRLEDVDRDGTCDRIHTVSDAWGLSGNYHEFAFGLPVDREGKFCVGLNLGFGEPAWWHGQSLAPWRGWVVKIGRDGTLEPFASGFRSPCGLALNAAGDLFVTDNQGDWVPTSSIAHVEAGRFYGAPDSLKWTSEYRATNTVPSFTQPPARERTPPAVWIPYGWSRSTGDLAPLPADGRFGPFGSDQMAVAEMTNGLVLRADLEKVRGRYQGAVMHLVRNVGAAIRTRFAPDGTLFLGLTNRGWGGRPPGHGIARVRWTGRTPLEVAHVRLLQDGFEIAFTEPLAANTGVAAQDVLLRRHHYDWWWEYGSPERDRRILPVDAVTLSADRRKLVLRASQLECGSVATVVLPELVSERGEPLLHREFAYSIHELPDGPPCAQPIARVAPPPPLREHESEGWLRLCYSDAFQMWESRGWKLADVDLDTDDPRRLIVRDGVGALVNVEPDAGPFRSRPEFGDVEVHAEFLLPEGGAAALRLMGRYELLLSATPDERTTSVESCGALIGGTNWDTRAPLNPAFRSAGEWHELDVVLRAPRFDERGARIEPARIVRASIDDVLLHEDVELPGPSAGCPADEVASAPFELRAVRGTVALGGVRAKAGVLQEETRGWHALVEDDDLTGWRTLGAAQFTSDDGALRSGGGRGFLRTEREDFGDVEVDVRVKVGGSAQSALWLRALPEGDGLAGYAIQLNADAPAAAYTGSIGGPDGLSPLRVQLVGPETWCRMRVRIQDEAGGTRVRVWLNRVLVNELLDTRPDRPRAGAIALEQHHAGSRVEIEDLRWR